MWISAIHSLPSRARAERGPLTKLNRETVAHVPQPYPAVAARALRGHRVGDTEDERAARAHRRHTHDDRALVAREPVHDRILDQRLQDEARHPCRRQRRGRRNVDAQPVSETPLLQLEVEAYELHLVAEA